MNEPFQQSTAERIARTLARKSDEMAAKARGVQINPGMEPDWQAWMPLAEAVAADLGLEVERERSA